MIQTIADALAERGYDTLTPVQVAVTDPELGDADLLVSAQTGSGKTVGFGLAIAPTLLGDEVRLERASTPLALVIAPTRELAFQVMRELSWLYAKAGAVVVSCVGGMDMRTEKRALERGAHIVVATPGRLRDHIQRNSLDMSSLRAVVLDEADEMLDLGFREDLEFILGEAPENRRTLMFSATVPPAIAGLARQYQRDAVRVTTVGESKQHSDIEYRALTVAQQDVENAIINVLRYHDAQNALVFANTRALVNRLTARFSNRGFSVVALSGELSQTERTHALQAMRDGRARVCVATDVAARGIDLPNLDLVVHAELPTSSETLLHRSGRTGRAGRKGVSTLIVPVKARKKAERLLKFAKVVAEWGVPPSPEEILARDEERLLADEVWSEAVSETEAEFAQKLLSLHSPETIAAAYLRLYRARQSAPEDLLIPDAAPPAAARKEEFGPAKWFSLSVGRDQRAEARWLLPLLCRAGNISKDAIGAIRIQQEETFVEIAEANAASFLSAVGPDMKLEDGVVLKALDRMPDLARPPRQDPAPRASEVPGYRKGGAAAYTSPEAPSTQVAPERSEDRKPRRPRADAEKPSVDRSAGAGLSKYSKPKRPPQDRDGDRPFNKKKPTGKPGDKPYGKSADKPYGKPGDKPYGKSADKPHGKPGDKPRGKPGDKRDKPFGKPGDKPGAKREKTFSKPVERAEPRVGATDTSKRFVPPGGKATARTGGKPRAGKGGAATPRRDKN